MTPFAVLPVMAVLVAAPSSPEEGCPSARQVTEAMQLRVPAYLLMPDQTAMLGRGDVLRSVLDVARDGTVVRFTLVDARGEVQLRRTLPARPGRGTSNECVALADTVAAIVERYLATIPYDGDPGLPALSFPLPPPSAAAAVDPSRDPARRRSGLAIVGAAWATTMGGQGEQGGLEVRLGAQFDLTRTSPRLAAFITGGASPSTGPFSLDTSLDPPGQPRTAKVSRFPFRLGALLELPAGPGWVEPSVQSGVDLMVVSRTGAQGAGAGRTLLLSPVVEGGVGYRLKVAGPLYVRPQLTIGVPLKRYDIGVKSDPVYDSRSVWRTPRGYALFGVDATLVFR